MKLIIMLFLAIGFAPAQDNQQWGPMVLTAIKGLMEWQPRAKGIEYEDSRDFTKPASAASSKDSVRVS